VSDCFIVPWNVLNILENLIDAFHYFLAGCHCQSKGTKNSEIFQKIITLSSFCLHKKATKFTNQDYSNQFFLYPAFHGQQLK